ncbi:MAG TPA: hypothetical protein G4O04_03920 [Anaerolineae bacterium]|nr:hypothetical protein [Anaerolineae bacterium]HID84307.1 hypothetical protein [Anaerolineales bacterium]
MQRQRLRAFWWAVTVVFLLALVAFRVAQRWTTWQQAEAHRQVVATRYAAMVGTATALVQEATAVASPEFVEVRARTEGKMARKGEVLVHPVPVPGAPPAEAWAQPTPTPTPTPTPAPWQVWWALFFARP